MTLIPGNTVELPKIKRTFTLTRNPLNMTRMSKRRSNASHNNKEVQQQSNDTNENDVDNSKNNKIFRRPSLKRFINKIAQHISGVPVLNQDNNRVPPVGLQTWGPDDTPGVTGLKNHGNTCFINAVLQCISHTDVLAEYFVLDRYKIDLSRRNKLNSKKFGTKGEVTEQLALLLKALWACQYSPELSTNFKQVVERHGSQYKGNQQHDALEFLQWLLDKVHEDLNTASKKKYKSIKTSGRPDEVIAAETLENYKRCNNSFIQGIFQAQYRSSLSCSRCRTQSNTFDPFQCISVQLPQFSKQSIYVTVLYTSQQPKQVKIGLSVPSGATVCELRHILESDTSIKRNNMIITEIGENGFCRTFTDNQLINMISEIDPIYCIEVPQLENVDGDITSAYILLCWINVLTTKNGIERFGSPYTMQVSRETSYEDLQKLILKEMASILHDDILTSNQQSGIFKIRIFDPACNENEPPCYLDPELEHPLFTEAIDQALALCSEEGGPPHVKFILEFTMTTKSAIISDDKDIVEEHSSVKQLRTQAMHGGIPLTLEECLTDYTEAETLTDAWRCPHCQQYQPVVKTLDMWSLPDILVVHLKRFRQQTLRGGSSAKLTTMVDFPVNNLDMTPHLANKKSASNNISETNEDPLIMANGWSPWKRKKQSTTNDNIYDLYGVCYHHGSDLETGHYTAACKNPYDNQWYLYDDAIVTNLSEQSDNINSLLVNNSAYILFYQRRNSIYACRSNNSSAASTSSVVSNEDHWISRMPKFIPPKSIKVIEKTTNNNKPINCTTTATAAVQNDISSTTTVVENIEDTKASDNDVALRNSQNTLNRSNTNIEKTSVDKSTNTNSNINIKTNQSDNTTKEQLYTTSIYINSTGDVNIPTKPIIDESKDIIKNLSSTEPEKRKIYTSVATVHRHTMDEKNTSLKSQLDWVSPQRERKNPSQQSL